MSVPTPASPAPLAPALAAPIPAQVPTPASAAPLAPPDPLAALRDWHLPDPVSWWPPAPGWWLLAGLALAAVALGARWWLLRRRASAPGRAALARLAQLRAEHGRHGDARRFAAEVSLLLRRLALLRYPRAEVAGLSGSDWLRFLDSTGGAGAFSLGAGQVLADAPYRSPGDSAGLDAAGLADLAGRWIRANLAGRPAGPAPVQIPARTAAQAVGREAA